MKKKANANKLKLKPIFMAFALMATSSALSFAACTTTEDTTDDGTNTETSVAKTDTQFIKNGNFEFYNENKDEDDEGVYYISSVNNWTNSSLGTPASDVKSGIIGTGDSVWKGFTATDLAGKLDANNELESDADDYEESYLDFNGLESSDLPFKDTEGSLKEDATISADSYIANPGAVIYTKNGKEGYYDNDGDFVELYKDGNVYYTDSAKTEEYNNHVLMVHNYTYSHKDSSENVIHNGTAQKYKSSTTVTLEANTVAEFSVWVKTTNLKFNGNNDVHQNRGAFIEVEHTVGGTTLDSMIIKNINTEKFAKDNVGESNNGWYNYTVYIEACDFASTTVTISLGLGESGAENYVEGYAFFDDIKMTKYTDLDKTSYDANSVKATCSLTDEADEKVFIADKLTHGEGAPDVRNSEDFKYLLDLTASQERVDANNSNVKYEVGLTVDANKYSSSKDMPTPVGNATKKTQTVTPFYPKFNIGTSDDVVAALKVTSIKNDITNVIKGNYANKIADALYTANALPGVDVSTDAVVILSTEGAAYTTSISAKAANTNFNVDANSYKIVSFWVKTSDMNGKTAATLAVSDVADSDNKNSFAIDTTNVTFNLDDENKDVYNGWVQCFFFVQNDTDAEKTFKMDFSFGNTSIKDTTVASYGYGWAMLANVQTFEVDEDEFNLIGSNSYSASLNFSESDDVVTGKFDEVYSSLENELKETVAAPTSYESILGNGTKIGKDNTTYTSGLVSKEHFNDIYSAYKAAPTENKYEWLATLANNNHFTAAQTAEQIWQELFGSKAVQPLLIVNSVKEYAGETAINRGYVGTTKTLAASGYQAVSVRVKVSEGAVAYIYLTDGKDVLSYTTPDYTFWYDDDGNVLKQAAEDNKDFDAIANIAYKVRLDGLYESTDTALAGKLFANLYNYDKLYVNEDVKYFDKDGNAISIDDIYGKAVSETYVDENGEIVEHYLVADDGTRLYKWNTEEKAYYYNEKGEYTKKVENFDVQYARYSAENAANEQYVITVDGNDANVAGKWVTVNFYLHAGSVSKSYRVELWNGERMISGLDANGDVDTAASAQTGIAQASKAGSYIVFDYSISTMDQATFDNFKANKENAIKNQYRDAIIDAIIGGADITLESNDESIDYYKQLAEENNITVEEKYNYNAIYHTYSLYDSSTYVPYNEETADAGDTNYEYDVSSYEEALAYLYCEESVTAVDGSNELAYTVFADYTTVDQSVSRTDVEADEEESEEDEHVHDEDETSIFLLVSSIVLVVALIIALLAMCLKDLIKKFGKISFGKNKKLFNNNKYDSSKRKHYIRKLKLTDESELSEDESVEEAPEVEAEPEPETVEESEEVVEEITESEEEPKDGE